MRKVDAFNAVVRVPSLDDVYRKFGDISEAVQLLETELGNVLSRLELPKQIS